MHVLDGVVKASIAKEEPQEGASGGDGGKEGGEEKEK